MQIGRRATGLFIQLSYHTAQTVVISVDGRTYSCNDSPTYNPPSPWTVSPSSSVNGDDDSDSPEESTVVADMSSGLKGSHTLAPNAYVDATQLDDLPLPATNEGSSDFPLQPVHHARAATVPSAKSLTTGVVDLTDQIQTVSPHAFAHGGFSDIHMAQWARRTVDGQVEIVRVVVKLLRILTRHDVDGDRAKRRLNREVFIWHRLDHPNIAKLFGTSYQMNSRPAMVMQWYQNGSASDFLMMNPNADRKQLVHDVAKGLGYLHHKLEPPIVHGDVKGNNVLVTADFHAVLTDFGLSQVIGDLVGSSASTTNTIAGSVRWQAPELVLEDENNQTIRLSFSSDIWAFACTAYELLTGRVPYYHRQREFSVILDIMQGVKPGKIDALPPCAPPQQDKIWGLLDSCWSVSANTRPKMIDVEDQLDLMWTCKAVK